MSFIQKLKDVFNQGPDSWKERIKPNLKLTTPEGTEYITKYINNTFSKDKRLGIYSRPFVSGQFGNDIGTNGLIADIPIYLDGKDCDLTANAILKSLDEIGPWEVDHPLYGFYELQPTKMSMEIDMVNSGNVILINSSWIEFVDPESGKTGRELAGITDKLSTDLNNSMLDNILNNIKYGSEVFKNTVQKTVNGIQNVTEFLLSPMAATIDAVDRTFWTAMDSLNDLELATVFQVEQLVGQIQNLIQAPLFAKRSAEERFDTYNNLGSQLQALLPGNENSFISDYDTTENVKNSAHITEIALAATVTAFAQIAITTPTREIDSEGNFVGFQSKDQIIDFIKLISDYFDDMTESLDSVQERTKSNKVSTQYFSQSETYYACYKLLTATIQYLLSVSSDTAIEKKIQLDRPRSPIDVAIMEYKGTGENDFNIDFFIASNNLTGDELLQLQAGRVVSIYV